MSAAASAHEGHTHHKHGEHSAAQTATTLAADSDIGETFTKDGKTYRWKHRADLGKQPEAMVAAAKGGLHNNADRDLQSGEVVTVVKDYGLVSLDPELGQWKLVEDQDELFAQGMNAHGADCFLLNGQSYWAFASTNTGEIVVSQRGKIVARLRQPKGDEFDNPTVNAYFAKGGRFTPCDVVFLPKTQSLVCVIGYAPGDFAMSAKISDGEWSWGGAAWGGKVNVGGPFNTAHGVQVQQMDDQEIVEIASRSHGRVYGFTPDGAEVRLPGTAKEYFIQLPDRSTPCNISHLGGQMFLPLLNPLADTDGVAPVLVMKDGKPVGRLIPANHEGLQFMHHMHGFCPVQVGDTLFGVALSWPNGGENKAGKRNDGQIAIFEAVEVQ
ncbi:hypothetical protein FYK55_19940 [Roseiconus nitratireducens]|uniref:Uncharacterized protein n=1 Tax=Roseiconus nitratireducens TaxID=2605748 RepID=A0A5M6D6D6_9BACT|nr:hypothetical protein FYK55_19940 [Roseiconus nitratireducens]